MQDKINNILTMLINQNKLVKEGLFDITEQHLIDYIETYDELYGNNGSKLKTASSLRYARKLAGLTFLKLKLERGATTATCKEGLVYLLTNPAWPEHLKVGMTTDLDKRVAVYQTYDPFRQYKVKHYEFVFDRRLAEKQILIHHKLNIEKGEWLKEVDAMLIVTSLTNEYASSKSLIKQETKMVYTKNKHGKYIQITSYVK